ncbi:MAG TPA: response regulator [Caproiciproducens sp.]|nr:response regulator [Caproiciproducens sp.]
MSDKLKLLIVDDEPLARKKILSFDLSGTGLEFAGEAENGRDALEKLDTLMPDIIITDIVMPVMDGIQLLEAVQRRPNPPKVIILSCYDDFDKVQAALRLGAQDYIVKLLLNRDDFVESVSKVASAVLREQTEFYTDARNALERLMKSRSGQEVVKYSRQLEQLGFHMEQFKLVSVSADRGLFDKYDEGRLLAEKQEGSFCCILPELNDGHMTYLFYTTKPLQENRFRTQSESMAAALAEKLKKAGWTSGRIPVITVGLTHCGLRDLQPAYQSLRLYERNLFYKSPKETFFFELSEAEPFGLFSHDFFIKTVESFYSACENGDGKALAECIQAWAGQVEKDRPNPDEVCSMTKIIVSSMPKIRCPVSENAQELSLKDWLNGRIASARFLSDICDCFAEAAEHLQKNGYRNSNAIRPEIVSALEYIAENYSSNITLQLVAKHVCLSDSWFSALFRTEMKQSFSEYLIHYRIEQAKRFLKYTAKTINQISENVGIADPHYFSRVFTKTVGLSPKEYRNQNRKKQMFTGALRDSQLYLGNQQC